MDAHAHAHPDVDAHGYAHAHTHADAHAGQPGSARKPARHRYAQQHFAGMGCVERRCYHHRNRLSDIPPRAGRGLRRSHKCWGKRYFLHGHQRHPAVHAIHLPRSCGYDRRRNRLRPRRHQNRIVALARQSRRGAAVELGVQPVRIRTPSTARRPDLFGGYPVL